MPARAAVRNLKTSKISGTRSGRNLHCDKRIANSSSAEAIDANYRNLMDHNPDAVFVTSPDCRRLYYANKAGMRFFGYRSFKQLNNVSFRVHFAPDQHLGKTATRVAKNEAGEVLDVSFWTKANGSAIAASGSVTPGQFGGLKILQWILRDITKENEKAEGDAAKAQFFDVLSDQIPAGVSVKDRNQCFVYANKRVLRGRKAKEILGKSLRDVRPKKHHLPSFADLAVLTDQVIKTGKPVLEHERSSHYDKDTVSLSSIVPMFDEKGRVENVLTVSWDITERKRAEDALAEQNALFHTIMDHLPLQISLRDAKRRYLFANKLMTEGSGREPADYIGKTARQVFGRRHAHPVDRAVANVLKTKCAQGGIEVDSIVRPDRKLIVNAVPVFDARGGVSKVLTMGFDITDRVLLERKIAEGQAELRAVLERNNKYLHSVLAHIPSFISIRDHKGRYKYINRTRHDGTFERGTERDGLTTEQALKSKDAAALDKLVQKVLKTGEPVIGYERPALTLGGMRLTHIVPIEALEGTKRNALVVSTDITAQKKAEEELKEKSAVLQAIFDNMPAEISMKDKNGRYLMRNLYMGTTGLRSDHYRGKTVYDVFGTPLARRIDGMVKQVARTGKPIRGFKRRPTNHPNRLFTTDMVPIKNADGDVEYVVSMAFEITDLHRTERELAQHRDQLQSLLAERTRELDDAQKTLMRQERLAVVGRLLATVSHELRNPLGTIKYASHLLRLSTESDVPKANTYLDRMDRGIARCENIVEDLLNYTRTPTVERKPVQVDSWCANFFEDLSDDVKSAVSARFDSGITAEIDKDRFHQVLQNLLQNAVQAARDHRNEEAKVSFTVSADKGCVKFVVSDNGPSVPADKRAEIFEPLFSTKTYGVGLGLSLVKQIVELHGGTISVDDNSAGGAVFAVSLPTGTVRAQ